MKMRNTGCATVLCTVLACGGGAKQGGERLSPTEQAEESLYHRVGGIDVLRRLVDAWMLEVASDSRIRDFFVGADIARVKLRLVERLCVLANGPCMYRGAELREHHSALGLEERHMRAFLDDLEPAMQRVDITGEVARDLREALLLLGAQIGSGIGE